MKLKTTTLTTTTRNRNEVPQRGCRREKVITLAGVSGAPLSMAWMDSRSAPW